MNDLISRAQASGLDDIDMDYFLHLVMNTCASLLGGASPGEIAAEFPNWYPARFGRFAPGRDKEFVIAIQRQGWCRLE